MKKILVASNNEGKIKEIKEIFNSEEIYSLKDLGIEIEVEEDCKTFYGNAFKKAKEITMFLEEKGLVRDYIVLADDSGLMIDALGGEPGVMSARYAGDHDFDANNRKVIEKLEGLEESKRTARYTCTVVCIDHDNGNIFDSVGVCEGYIANEIIYGDSGFAYDSIFIPAENNPNKLAFSQLSSEFKNSISHRKRALEGIISKIK